MLPDPPVSDAAQPRLQAGVADVFDMHCAACAVLIESALEALPGVQRARVHYATQRAHVDFDAARIAMPAVVEHIERLGYGANLGAGLTQAQIERMQRRQRIWGFGLAVFCAMQIMMLSVPRFFAGADMEPELAWLVDWGALLLTLPVLWVSGRPFYRGALRELRLRRMGMDTAISFAIWAAFAGSVWHMWLATSALYFDSVAMFIALLLGVRWLEWEQRQSNLKAIRDAVALPPQQAVRLLPSGQREPVAGDQIAVGDRLWITPGTAFPVDGELLSEAADCDESLLSGESRPLRRVRGDSLVAGAINCGGAVVMQARATAAESTQARLLATAEAASKPETLAVADRAARYFMPCLLLLTLAALLINWPLGATVAIERAIAVLIISCPCALALAAPSAFARGFAGLLSRGVVVRRAHALERLAQVDHFLLDKTGTLTVPNTVRVSELRDGVTEQRALALIAALEAAANHPLATALRAAVAGELPVAEDPQWSPREGVSGRIDGVSYRFGRQRFAGGGDDGDDAALWLSDERGVVCRAEIGERLRDDALALVAALQRRGEVEILSGDQEAAVARAAQALKLPQWRARCTPQDKAARLAQLQRDDKVVAMIGDGINDSITLAGADVSIAVASAADAARANADVLSLRPELRAIDDAIGYVRRLRRIVMENFFWASAYNLLAVPCAIMGWVNPVAASVGMAASSAVVMLNVQRLSIRQREAA